MKKLSMKVSPRLSIVIPTYNTKQLLLECLDSIYTVEKKESLFEIIVVDNGSDDSSEAVRSKFSKVVLVKGTNNGFAHSVNLGWKKASGDQVLFLNSDTVVKRPFIEKVINYMDANKEVGALSLKLTLRSGKVDPDTHRGLATPWATVTFFFLLENLFPKSRLFGQYHKAWLGHDTIHEIDAGAGASMVVRKSILEELGGWDETYYFYGEDLDLCFRITEAGWKIMFYPDVDIIHYKGATSGLKKESKDVARKLEKKEFVRLTRSTIQAWDIFVRKFYKDKYPKPFLWFVLFGIRTKGILRITLFNLGVKL